MDPRTISRRAVAGLLQSTPAFDELDPAERSRLARLMVTVGDRAALLAREELDADAEVPSPVPLATAQAAGDDFSGVAADRVAATTRSILTAVSFPRFVNELITGVFKAILDSNAQQLTSYIDLLQNVSASSEGFADANLGPGRARSWLVEQFPGSFTLDGDPEDDPPDPDDADSGPRLRLVPGGSPPSEPALRVGLGLSEGETVPAGDPERTLVPLARRALARQRQQMLATMVLLGMQRIVVDAGRINASMRFHIDTRSAAAGDRGSTFDTRTSLGASGSFGVGPWGASASLQSTIGYVSTERSQTTEEMNTDLDLNSSVELQFRSDQVPLDRLATSGQSSAIRANSVNPEAEEAGAVAARAARQSAARAAESARSAATDTALRSAPPPPAAPPVVRPTAAAPTAAAPTAPAPTTPAPTTPAPTTSAPTPPVVPPVRGR